MDGVAALERTRVPAEFTGRARAFLREVQAEDRAFSAVVDRITAPLANSGRPGFRQPRVAEVLAQWRREVPARFLVKRAYKLRGAHLEVFEFRVVASKYQDQARFDEWESGVSLVLARLDNHRQTYFHAQPLAMVSLHGLGRWFQRTGLTDEGALLRALVPLAGVALTAPQAPAQCRCAGGTWHGSIDFAKDEAGRPALTFLGRTFIDLDGIK